MNILSIETSCDDTSIAIVEARGGFKRPCFNILSNVVSSQTKIHAPYGGVVPFLAARAHQRNLPICLEEAFALPSIYSEQSRTKSSPDGHRGRTKVGVDKINLIAVTTGPGLEPSLWAGVNFAKSLSLISGIPIIGVNHIEGHICANWLEPIRAISNFPAYAKASAGKQFLISEQKRFPILCLVVSGGHTQLILIKDYLKYKLLGETRDDAAGEAFDKVAKLLGLGYPGGPQIARLAQSARKYAEQTQKNAENLPRMSALSLRKSARELKLPRPMINSKDFDFSFSGLKTAVLYKIKELGLRLGSGQEIMNQELRAEIAAEFQQAVIDVLISKTLRAAKKYKVKTIMLGGGVAANEELRKQFNYQLSTKNYKLKFLAPPKIFCTDNAAMISAAGYFRFLKNGPDKLKNMKANANLRIV